MNQIMILDINKVKEAIVKFLDLFDNPREIKLFKNFVISQAHIKNNYFKLLESHLRKENKNLIDYYNKNKQTNLEEKFIYVQFMLFYFPQKMNIFFNSPSQILDDKIHKLRENETISFRDYYGGLDKIKPFKPESIVCPLLVLNEVEIFIDRFKLDYVFNENEVNKKINDYFSNNLDYFLKIFKENTLVEANSSNSNNNYIYTNFFYTTKYKEIFSKIYKEKFLDKSLDILTELSTFQEFTTAMINVFFGNDNKDKVKFNNVFFDLDINQIKTNNLLIKQFKNVIQSIRSEDAKKKFHRILYLQIIKIYPYLTLFNLNFLVELFNDEIFI
ncbi:MAG: hypothetical protein PF569_09450, partial [Candidatus Woesearchaeota archaeon]|nr:hypothetical protein [Candidatus Woesearchaeota archaeon]